MIFSKKGELAIRPIFAPKVDIEVGTGFARATARTRVILADLAFAYEYNGRIYEPGKAKVILPGAAALAPWAKQEYEIMAETLPHEIKTFVVCPESAVLGFQE